MATRCAEAKRANKLRNTSAQKAAVEAVVMCGHIARLLLNSSCVVIAKQCEICAECGHTSRVVVRAVRKTKNVRSTVNDTISRTFGDKLRIKRP